ncbi:Hypothetical protein SMAX5B_011435 [Scophthalmus maximus]|uniref:Uncharacterized protein n=1 Tax=Scophthalmus maximus TaxID=52904 RepID=A0A2U9BNJ9_SCOMX|nr:Hypothetical protein SMAX5B_011435 [Scophthalmus maximus]
MSAATSASTSRVDDGTDDALGCSRAKESDRGVGPGETEQQPAASHHHNSEVSE